MSRYDDNSFDQATQPSLPSAMPPSPPPPTPPQPAASVHRLQYSPPRPVVRRRWRFHPACLGCALALVAIIGIVSCITLVVLAVAWNNLSNQLTDRLDKAQKQLEQQTFQTTRIYARDGQTLLHELLGEGRRTNIKLADVPQSMIDATVAVEDSTFWENPGVDWPAILRAGLQYFQAGYSVSGASTITQQLVRNIAFDYQYRQERSVRRKLEEIGMALILTRQKSKQDILELYLNQIYYGNLAYGVEAAAQTYFGKSAKQLNLAEASLLAGLPQAPAELDPLNPDPTVQEAVFARRKVVLDLMVDKGKISREDAAKALAQPLVYANPNINLRSPHFTLYAEQELKSLLDGLNLPPSYLSTAGLKVITTLDPGYESLAENVARQQIAAIKDQHNAHNAAVVILKVTTGEILAMMGSVDYNDDSIQGRVNVAISPKQPGSAMKLLTYAAAMEQGKFTPASILWDVETHIRAPGLDYSPVDYDRRFHGPVRVRDALANSYNIPAVETLRTIGGAKTLLDFAQRMRVNSLGTDASKYGLSLTLGGGELTPLELTQAYAIVANGGVAPPVTSILCVIDGNNHVVYQYEDGCSGKGKPDKDSIKSAAPDPNNPDAKKLVDPRVAFVLRDILADNVARSPAMGSNSPLRTDGIVTSVKTGTTNDYRDNWTVGFTRNVVVGVWVGNTDSKPMVNSSGLTGAAPIWHDVMTGIYSNPDLRNILAFRGTMLSEALNPPPGLYKRQICNIAALKDPATACPPGRSEWFFDGPPATWDPTNGKLIYPPRPPAPTRVPANRNGPIVVDVEPGIVQTIVQPLDPGLAGSLVNNPKPGQPAGPPPLYCLVPNEVKEQITTASVQFFIRPPSYPQGSTPPGTATDTVYAYIYAQNAGIPILPGLPCTPEMLVAIPQVPGATARITSPKPGETVTGMVEVSGIASWQQGQAAYYKMEIQGPQFPNWTTFGQTHNTPTINGPLDRFGAEGLQPGIYKLRIVIVGVDGNYLLLSGETPVNVTGQ